MANVITQILGVRGYDLATRRGNVVTPANFTIGGIMGFFQRKYAQAFRVSSLAQFATIFGGYFSSAAFGPDVVADFFNNLAGLAGEAYIAAYVGNPSGTIDAVVASQNLLDTEISAQPAVKVQPGYQGVLQYGTDGNNTGVTVESGSRFSTVATAAGASNGTTMVLASVADIEVGDAIWVVSSGGGAQSKGFTVTLVNSATNTVTISVGIGVGKNIAIGDAVTVPGFRIHTWRTNNLGQAVEVDTDLGKQWLTYYAAVSDHYFAAVFAKSNYIVLTQLTITPSDPTYANLAAVATITPCASGADGTQPAGGTQASQWNNTLQLFNGLPVRFLANAESSTLAVQVAGEAYCFNRWDSPCWIYLFSASQSLAQLVTSGNGYQRSGKVSGLSAASTWGLKSDPYNTSSVAPTRAVPAVGAVMGLAIRILNKYGIHYTYGLSQEPIVGWLDVLGFQAPDDGDRTTLAQAGVNVIQNLAGSGIVLRNAFTPSTTIDFVFVNALIMGNFIKVSCQGSLQATENFPLTYAKLQADRSAIDSFMRLMWLAGSTGNAPEGETFGQTIVQSADGTQTYSTYEQCVSVEANLVNNPQSALQAGNEQLWVYFMRPAPAGSIRIGVGIQLAA